MRAVGIALTLSLLCVGAAWSEDAQQPPERLPELKLALDVTLTTAIVVEALKRTFKNPRPDGSDYGFPSGDAAQTLHPVTCKGFARRKEVRDLVPAAHQLITQFQHPTNAARHALVRFEESHVHGRDLIRQYG